MVLIEVETSDGQTSDFSGVASGDILINAPKARTD